MGLPLTSPVHAPRDFQGAIPVIFHAHLLATTREMRVEGLGAKNDARNGGRRPPKAWPPPVINELLHVRETLGGCDERGPQQAHQAARIDHRSLDAQGIDREPQPHIPRAAFEMERLGDSERGG